MTTMTIPATSIGDEDKDISPGRANFFRALNAEIRIRRRELTALEGARDALLASARRSEPADVPEPGPSEPGGALRMPEVAETTTRPHTVADAVEIILAEGGPLHARTIVEELRLRFHMKTTSKNLINTLNRWISRGSRFKRPGPNTFALDRIRLKPNGRGVMGANGGTNGHAGANGQHVDAR